MNVLIAEDEILAAERLVGLVKQCDPSITIAAQTDTVQDTVEFFRAGNQVDVLLLDIQLSDGKSFDIFTKVQITAPIIFTTAYNQYALEAFKHFSIDYILKPVQYDDLCKAFDKLNRFRKEHTVDPAQLAALREFLDHAEWRYKQRFVVKSGNKLQFKSAKEVSYFYADGKIVYLVSKENKKYIVDHTLEQIETMLNPNDFFRISRKFIICIDAIGEVKGLMSSRFEVKLSQPCEHSLTVSRDNASSFRAWLDR